MRLCACSCILLAAVIVVVEGLCDPFPTADQRGQPSASKPGVSGAPCLGRRKRSPILGLNLNLGGLLGTPTTQASITTNVLPSMRIGGGYTTGRGNQNAATGRQPTLFEKFGFTDMFEPTLGRGGTQPNSVGGSETTATARPTSGTGVGHNSGTSGHRHPSTAGNGRETTSTSTATSGSRVPVENTTREPPRVATVAPTGGCILPQQPIGGSYQLDSCRSHCSVQPETIVPVGSFLTYTCDEGYIIEGINVSFCHNNTWVLLPTCTKTCRPLDPPNSVDIVCRYQGTIVSCKSALKSRTKVTMSCKPSYKMSLANDPGYREINCLDEGVWDRTMIRCMAECGTQIAQGNTLIVSGFTAKIGVFPWHVAIYQKNLTGFYMQICGGTLISPSLVISAAHCFYDDTIQQLEGPENYAVAAGKHYRSFNWPEKYVQKSEISVIEKASRYYGASGNFAEDIALLTLKSPFILSTLVRPICMDWENRHERDHFQSGSIGKAVGWGKTAEGVPSTELQEINLPYIPFEQCMSAVPSEFRGYVTSDKFCAGYLNGSSLCEGDSGGGLAFRIGELWYLRGIVSVSPVAQRTCDNNYYTAFTNVGNFVEWIHPKFLQDG